MVRFDFNGKITIKKINGKTNGEYCTKIQITLTIWMIFRTFE